MHFLPPWRVWLPFAASGVLLGGCSDAEQPQALAPASADEQRAVAEAAEMLEEREADLPILSPQSGNN